MKNSHMGKNSGDPNLVCKKYIFPKLKRNSKGDNGVNYKEYL